MDDQVPSSVYPYIPLAHDLDKTEHRLVYKINNSDIQSVIYICTDYRIWCPDSIVVRALCSNLDREI